MGLEILSDENFVFCDGDSTVLDAGSGFSTYRWSTGETSDTIVTYGSDTINVAVTDGSGCWDYDTVTTFKHEVYDQEKICMVTVFGEQNLIVWERTQDKGTEFYNIYKETEAADEYEIIGTVPYSELSVFTDLNSENKTRVERYKISAVDTCGNESDTSLLHKTMHLTLNVGLSGESNLIWENYKGIDFVSYAIFRGTRADNMVEFDVIPNNITSYTDWEFGEFFYSIGVIMPDGCSPALFLKAGAGPYSHALSNTEDNRLQINLPPSEIYISDSTLLEDQPAGSYIGKFSTYDADSAGTFVYSLVAGEGADDNISFTISHDSLFSAEVLDYDVKVIYNLRVRSTDSEEDTLWAEKKFRVHVTALDNEAPTDISLDNNAVAEAQPAGTFVGKLTTTDPDEGDTHIYSLVEGDGWPDNGSFNISGDSLFTAEVFDYDTKSTYNIRVRTTDDGAGLLYFEKQIVITVAANTAPTDITLSGDNLDEKLPAGTFIGKFSTTDDGIVHTYTLEDGIGGEHNNFFTISNDSLLSKEEFNYLEQTFYSILVRSTDEGSLYFQKSFVIQVNPTGIEQARNDLRIFPVPMTEYLTIEFPYQSGQEYILVMTDLNGQRVKMINNIHIGSIELDASDLAPGIYILELRGPVLLRSRIVKTQ
ncbi:MAG: cadherin domain-containing protein [Bacteroidales bacterium]|nr:cadherin domain-containing protein [Bacteroidales bacterium]